MSAKATFWAWEQDLKHTTKIVLLALADYNSEKGECWPSTDSLAKKTGLSKCQVLREIKALESGGFMTVKRAQGRSSRYFLNMQTGSTQRPVADSDQYQADTKAVADSDQTGSTQRPKPKREPKKNLEDNAYAFCGETIKLNQEDFDKAKSQYRNLNLVETLRQLDMELREDKKWWGTMHAKLNYRNRNHASNRPQGNQQGSSTQKLSAVERVRQLGQQREAELDRQLAEIERQRASHQAPEGYDPSVVSSQ